MKPIYLIIHHTGGSDANPKADTSHHTLEIVDAHHKSLGWGEIGYHYFIEKDGKVRIGRAETKQGAHTIGYNDKSLGICLAGNFDVTLPTKAQEMALKTLCRQLMAKYSISADKVVPHRRFATKTCYGALLSDKWITDLIQNDESEPKELALIFAKIREGLNELEQYLPKNK